MQLRQTQTAYDAPRVVADQDLDSRVQTAIYGYLRDDLGLSEAVALARSAEETTGAIGVRRCEECELAGLNFQGARVLELGAGLGAVSVEMARRHARVIAIEPGAAWRKLASDRLARVGSGSVIGALGESLPLRDNSIDLIVSFQVLEHVQYPEKVIREAFRVLKPGGYFLLTYENYLSFWEPHYKVRWLPLLPKSIGAFYLSLLGRDPRFLKESVTYTTFPFVRSAFFRAGFECMRLDAIRKNLRSPLKTSLKWRALKKIAQVHEPAAMWIVNAVDYIRRITRTAADEFMKKPLKSI